MALNPAYDQQSTRPLPFCLGYVFAQGEKVNSIIGFDNTSVEQYVLGYGEWDSCLTISVQPTDYFVPDPTGATTVGGGTVAPVNTKFFPSTPNPRLVSYHFHGGQFAAKGVPRNLISLGPDQGTENWLQYFPSVTPALTFSGLAYYFVRRTVASTSVTPMNPIGIYKTLRCRTFDATGEVSGYGFTTNPTWHMIETLLRFQFKCQQPGLAGLTAAEKACFDWPAMVAHAQRNSFVLPNGRPRFTSNFAFAAKATLANMMEPQLRNCRSFKRERGGVLSFVGDDTRAAAFTLSQRNVVPGSLHLDKKSLSTAPNVYVPQYRDLEIPAVAGVATASSNPVSGGGYNTTFTTLGAQPFFSQDVFAYSGSANDALFAGYYQVNRYTYTDTNGDVQLEAPPIANQFIANSGPAQSTSTTGGYLGTEQSRFKQRAPMGVQHRSHQRSTASPAPGITALPRATPVQYDLGNNTFDQTNRLMKFMRDRELGPDVANWVAPFKGTLSAYLNTVDVNGVSLEALECGDVVTLDDTVLPEFAPDNPALPTFKGDFEVLQLELDHDSDEVALTLQSYFWNAPTDVSDPPGDSYQTLPNNLLDTTDQMLANPFWLMRATPTGFVASDGTITLGLPDLSLWWQGQPVATAYSGVQLTGIPANTHIILYLKATFLAVAPTLTLDTTNTYPPVPMPAGQVVIFIGSLSSAPSNAPAPGNPTSPAPGPIGVPTPAPGRPQATMTPLSGYVGSAAVPNDTTPANPTPEQTGTDAPGVNV